MVIEERVAEAIDHHLDDMVRRGEAERRDGHNGCHLPTELGNIGSCVSRTRGVRLLAQERAYAPRAQCINRMILAYFIWPCYAQGGHGPSARLSRVASTPSMVRRMAKARKPLAGRRF